MGQVMRDTRTIKSHLQKNGTYQVPAYEPELRERSRSRSPFPGGNLEVPEPRGTADSEWADLWDNVGDSEHIRPPTEGDLDPPTLQEVLLTVLDWYAAHKQTFTATSDLLNILRLVVPPGTRLGTFNMLRQTLERHRLETCRQYDACPKGCVVYHDFTGVFREHQFASLDECPYCCTPRYVGMPRVASHCVYFFPIAPFLRDMFSNRDLVEGGYLDNRPGNDTPETSIKRSRGYRSKVLDEPSLRGDRRHQGICLSADGMPYFEASSKHSRGAWPLVARLASLPDGLWNRFELAHLYGFEATEHWATDVETGLVHRKRKDMSTLNGLLMLITEDLFVGYHEGFPCPDMSSPLQDSVFMCKVRLLLVEGDIPAIAKLTGFVHQGDSHCQWCNQASPYDTATNRHYSADFRRWLPQQSMERAAGGNFREAETRGPPLLRTHREVAQQGIEARDYKGPKSRHPKHTTGIKTWCPLTAVPGFDSVWDVTADFMHVNLWYPSHVLQALKGKTKIANPRYLQLELSRPLTPEEVKERKAHNDDLMQRHTQAKEVQLSNHTTHTQFLLFG